MRDPSKSTWLHAAGINQSSKERQSGMNAKNGETVVAVPPFLLLLYDRENDGCKCTEYHHYRHDQAEDSQASAHCITSLS